MASNCVKCKWFESHQPQVFARRAAGAYKDRCLAYPKGVPDDIFLKGTEHDYARPDQEGHFVFEPTR